MEERKQMCERCFEIPQNGFVSLYMSMASMYMAFQMIDCNFIKKETLAKVFFLWILRKNFKKTFSYSTLTVAASVIFSENY